ncbi:MAG: HNH endonuclease [Ignavibacteriaceae bacterium]|nr:HNH endonuclease [Ignavibacteriaceae bacterium]
MTKSRTTISKEIKEKVLKEFNHRCAICGSVNPHLHHIDENPSNNEIENLIPLCPNHHLSDQHNPTSTIPFYKMKLFREYKDPTILLSKFDPLYQRIIFLYDIHDKSLDNELIDKSGELIRFISFLNMGEFYKQEVQKLISSSPREYSNIRPLHVYAEEYRGRLISNRKKTIDLIVELLRYQNWSDKESGSKSTNS